MIVMDSLLQILLAAVTAVVITALIAQLLFRYDYTWLFRTEDVKAVQKIPGPTPLPYFGDILRFNLPKEERLRAVTQLHEEFGETYRLWIVGIPAIVITNTEDIEVVLSSSSHITKSTMYETLMPWLCTGLLTSGGEKWHLRRKIITPTFHFKILEQYVDVFNAKCAILVDLLEKRLHDSHFAINDMIKNCTVDIICESAMGVSVNAQTGGNTEYVNAVNRVTDLMVLRLACPWLYRDSVYFLTPAGREQKRLIKILHSFTEEVIHTRMEERRLEKTNKNETTEKRKRLAFLDLLLEIADNDGLLSKSDIREEVDTFMFEGHDTTAIALMWALLLLGSHPEVQDKVADELRGIFGDSKREATYNDLQKMTYLEMVIKETLRLYPSVPALARKLLADVDIKNYKIPAGAEVLINVAGIHRNPKVFPQPHVFNPDNFLPENVKDRHPFAYIPFSAGPRNCIGQRFALLEEKVMLSSILRNFRIESLDKPEDNPPMYELVYRPKFDIRLKLYRR